MQLPAYLLTADKLISSVGASIFSSGREIVSVVNHWNDASSNHRDEIGLIYPVVEKSVRSFSRRDYRFVFYGNRIVRGYIFQRDREIVPD